MNRIRERERRKAALSDRKSAAAQARMKNIANLATDDRVPKKKRKGGGGLYTTIVSCWARLTPRQKIHLELMTQIGQYTARSYVSYPSISLTQLIVPENRRTLRRRRGRSASAPNHRTKAPHARSHVHTTRNTRVHFGPTLSLA